MSKEKKDKKVEETKTEETKVEEKEEAKSEEEKVELTNEQKLEKQLADEKERYLRLAAEYDNFRKRSVKEKENTFNDAKATILKDLLPVLDNFDRACAQENAELTDYKKGIDMTYQQFTTALAKFGVESFGDAKDKFDPNFHNAVMHVEDENFEDNTVAEVFQKGYKLGEKVLRPAMVKVAN